MEKVEEREGMVIYNWSIYIKNAGTPRPLTDNIAWSSEAPMGAICSLFFFSEMEREKNDIIIKQASFNVNSGIMKLYKQLNAMNESNAR